MIDVVKKKLEDIITFGKYKGKSIHQVLSPDMTTATSVDLLTFQQMLLDYKQTAARVEELGILEIPDVFNLKPLSSQRITFTIRETKPASFYFVSEGVDTGE